MSEYAHTYADDVTALRRELTSVRARQEVLADALAAAGEELEKLKAVERERDEWKQRAEQRWAEIQQACERAELAYRERDTLRATVLKVADDLDADGEVLAAETLRASVSPEGEA